MPRGRFWVGLAMTAVGLNFVSLKVGDVYRIQSPLLICVAFCLPAVFFGAMSWWTEDSAARTRPVVLCALLAWGGLILTRFSENHRGFVSASYITMALPLAALIVETRSWWFAVRVYVLASVAALAIAFWFEYEVYGLQLLMSSHRFGFLMSNDGNWRLSNPNLVGAQLALAAVLAFVLYLRSGQPADTGTHWVRPLPAFSLGWTVLLSLGCVLTASRGAFMSLLAGLGLMFIFGTRNQRCSRLRDLAAIFTILVLLTAFAAVAVGFKPWDTLQRRLDAEEEVFTASGRLIIWQQAYSLWASNLRYVLIGTGPGEGPEVLGRYLGLTLADEVTPAPLDAHNAFVEWGLDLGLAGIAAGVCMLTMVWRKSRQLDRREGTVYRQAIVATFGLSAMNFVTHYQFYFVAAGALILAMLSESPEADSRSAGGGLSEIELIRSRVGSVSSQRRVRSRLCADLEV